ncbi:MAG: molybdopterin molybdotransferase MoeA [Alphaproteobacteria bacterium]|nr:molybdopterin molybdotransferase MoeA [Alphaproteobacteria bacterium]MBV9061472.1 molybdopterin molybdotransferase MoeA [Alphaproteobacteria bacterium]
MISVEEAVARITSAFSAVDCETVAIDCAAGRVLAEDAIARLDQPPFAVSAMDGYAVRAADVTQVPARLNVIGSAPAGKPFEGSVCANQAVRIFTGGVVPDGADAIVIQEDTDQGQSVVSIGAPAAKGKHIRPAAQDFRAGDVLVRLGRQLSPRDVALIAAGDVPFVSVRRRPRIVVAATGDELSEPGTPRKPGGIVASSVYGLIPLIEKWGGVPHSLGILPDRIDSIAKIAEHAADADIIVTLGGASVGDHDLIQRALGPKGFTLDFWKIAMRPGKPLIFGRLSNTPLLGLPGNPVSSFVCALLFLKPAIAALLGARDEHESLLARLAAAMPANDGRQDYVRAKLLRRKGELWVEPFPLQDSSMQKALAEADGLVVRPPHALAASKGEAVPVIPLE